VPDSRIWNADKIQVFLRGVETAVVCRCRYKNAPVLLNASESGNGRTRVRGLAREMGWECLCEPSAIKEKIFVLGGEDEASV